MSLLAAGGLIVIALGNNDARLDRGGSGTLFWAGLLLIYLPIALRLFGRGASREERWALVLVLGLALYIAKILESPGEFTLHDELGWWRAVSDLLRTGHLFSANPLVSNFGEFPELTAVTGAVRQLTGLSIFTSALILIGFARVILILALFLAVERTVGSARAAGIAIVVYAGNPSFLYFDSQFSYESLALALAAGLLIVVMRGVAFDSHRRGPGAAAIVASLVILEVGLIITHHLTSYAMVAFFALWAVAIALIERGSLSKGQLAAFPANEGSRGPVVDSARMRLLLGPAFACVLLAALALAWFVFVSGSATQTELDGVFKEAASSLYHLIVSGHPKTLFKSGTGKVDSLATRALGLASVAILVVVVPLGAWRAWRSWRTHALAISLAVVSLLYLATLGLRLTQAGSETSQRASEFVFIGVGFVAALLFLHLAAKAGRQRERLYALLATILAGVVFVGGVIVGVGPESLQPGPFEVGAQSRSISPQGVAAARFAAAYLPRGSRILTHEQTGLLLGSYGHLDPVLGHVRGIPVTTVFYSRTFDASDRAVIIADAIDYIVVDRRLSTSTPVDGAYFERGEGESVERTRPLGAVALQKFERVPGISKVFENGPIAIYDTSGIRSQ